MEPEKLYQDHFINPHKCEPHELDHFVEYEKNEARRQMGARIYSTLLGRNGTAYKVEIEEFLLHDIWSGYTNFQIVVTLTPMFKVIEAPKE